MAGEDFAPRTPEMREVELAAEEAVPLVEAGVRLCGFERAVELLDRGERVVFHTRGRCRRGGDDDAQPCQEAAREAVDGFGAVEIFAESPAGLEAAGGDEAVDLDDVRALRTRAVPGAGGFVGDVKMFCAREHLVELPEVVEKHGRVGAERAGGFVVGEVAQEAVAQAAMRDGAELCLDGFEGVRTFVKIEADGEDRGEPAGGAGEVGEGCAGEFGEERFLASVAFEIEEE